MRQAVQAEIVGRFLDLERRGTTQLAPAMLPLGPAEYVSPERFERERRLLFREAPVVACLSADLPQPGDFFALESGDIPLVVVRDGNGSVRAYVNVCRHRANQVADGAGNTGRSFTCAFHNWSYAVDDGRLLGQPRSCEGFAEADPATLGLVPVPVDEAHGVVMVRPQGDDPVDVDTALCGLGADLDDFDLASYHVFDRRRSIWRCNWKLLLDTFFESYHLFALHVQTVGGRYPGHIMMFDAYGPNMRIPVARASLYEQADSPATDWQLLPHSTLQYFLGPNVMLNHVVDHFVTWRFVPTAVDETVADLTLYTPHAVVSDDDRSHYEQAFATQFGVTTGEDYPVSERIHHALASGRVEGTLIGRNEAAVVYFHETVAARLAEPARG
jgi:phenylpropionate dioxygenase-like ring-hydroxylating dioxygenase large terminal subunit